MLDLRERSGLSYQEIAEREGIRVTAVETLIWRARQAFKREFEALSGEGCIAGIPVTVLGVGLLRRMLRAAGRAAGSVPARLSALGPQAVVATVGGAVATAALVVASASGGPHPASHVTQSATALAPVTRLPTTQGHMQVSAPANGEAHHAAPGRAATAGQRPLSVDDGSHAAGPARTVSAPAGASHRGGAGGAGGATSVGGSGGSDPSAGPPPGGLVKQINKVIGGAVGVLGTAGQVVTSVEGAVADTTRDLANALTSQGVTKMLNGDVNDAVAALKGANSITSVGSVLASAGSVPGAISSGLADAGGSVSPPSGGTGERNAGRPSDGRSSGLLGNLLG